jgi:hypothetical protein
MSVEQPETMTFDCTDCGNGQQLVINNVKRGFFETGWRANYSRQNQPAFVCASCVTNWNGRLLRAQREYLEHIFEAQWRFGE